MEQEKSTTLSENDRERVGLVLCGGGGKGAYQIGCWKALKEAGIAITVVSGTSVGALNAALVAEGNLEKAEDLWNNITNKMVFRVRRGNALALLFRLTFFFGFDDYRKGTAASDFMFARAWNATGFAFGIVLVGLYIYVAHTEAPNNFPHFLQYKGWYSYPLILPLIYIAPVIAMRLLSLIFSIPSLCWRIADRLKWFALDNEPLERTLSCYLDAQSVSSSSIRAFVCRARPAVTFDPEKPTYTETPGSDGRLYDALPWKEYLPVYSLLNGRSPGEIRMLLMQSACLPFGIFGGEFSNNEGMVDGGLADNTPVKPLLDEKCDTIIIIHLNHRGREGEYTVSDRWELAMKIAAIDRLLDIESKSEQYFQDFVSEHGMVFRPWDMPNGSVQTEKAYAEELLRILPKLVHIIPSQRLGGLITGTLRFSPKKARRLMALGYRDTTQAMRDHGFLRLKTDYGSRKTA